MALSKYILSLDQGTTGTRAFLFDTKGRIVTSAYKEFKQYFPKPGWVEHDSEEIWNSCVVTIREAISKSRIKGNQILAIGITNQRETTVLWDRTTSKPVGRAIVWQCRRTASLCEALKKRGLTQTFRVKTGLVLDPYFSGTKVKWFLDSVPSLARRAKDGTICFGTIDSWLIWKLTWGRSHTTDVTNASRTLLFNIKTLAWDKDLLKILQIPKEILPQTQNSGSIFGKTANGAAGLPGGIPIAAVMGDQQAALYGQGCYEAGTVKNTYGTGCFMVLNTGHKLIYSKKGLLTTVACDGTGKPVYALEGSIFIAGAAVQWLRDGLKVITSSSETETAITGIPDTGGVYFVPAFVGLGAPYWNSEARGIISGLTRGTTTAHIVRAALESIAYQTKGVFDIMQKDFGRRTAELRVDGGACKNNFLMQFQADMLGCRIIRPMVSESTAQGVAHLAGVTMGLWNGQKDLRKLHKVDRVFKPAMPQGQRAALYKGWSTAVKRALTS